MPREDRDIRIGLTPQDFLSWQGGRELFAFIAEALEESLRDDDQLAIVTGIENYSAAWRLGSKIKTTALNFVGGRKPLASAPVAEPPSARLYRRGMVDVIGPLIRPPHRVDVPWVGYIPDVQHRRLPDMFSAPERAERDRRFRAVLQRASVTLVNAADVADDLRHFYPEGRSKIIALPFAACAEPAWFDDPGDVLARYGLGPGFFLCSNQFWKHKNHGLVFDAVALAKQCGTPIRLVVTGETTDYRHPEYAPQLFDRIGQLGIADDVTVLGFIPKHEQIQLMRAARAVVQPSLFEGSPGGGAIYNAVALGVPTIVSDLAVNREIAALVTHFFDPSNPQDLLEKLLAVQAARPVRAEPSRLLAEGQARRRAFGRAIRQAFAEAGGG